MENNSSSLKKWGFRGNSELKPEPETTIRGAVTLLQSNINQSDTKPVISMSHSQPSPFPYFNTTQITEDAVGYSPTVGILPARRHLLFPLSLRAVVEYLSQDLPHKLSPDDVFLTMGCKQAAQGILQVLAGSKSNILLPKPTFPYYDLFARSSNLEVHHFDLLPEKDWEVDLDSVVADTTVLD